MIWIHKNIINILNFVKISLKLKTFNEKIELNILYYKRHIFLMEGNFS